MSHDLDPRHVLLRPLVTEKSLKISERRNAYSFAVDLRANKVQIRRAVESLFKVKVIGVRTDVRPPKPKRFGAREAHSAEWKRALVTLKAGDTIQLY